MSSEEDWALLKSLSNQGRSDSGEWLTHAHLGYNYRLDDVSAAIGLAQLERVALAEAREGMVSQEELRHKPYGTEDRHAAWQAAKTLRPRG